MMKILLSCAAIFLLTPFASIEVTVTTTAPATGKIHLAIYATEAAFLAEKADYGKVVGLQRSKAEIATAMEGLPPGQYVIAGFHDVNGNGKLDKNFMGIPMEPYGFSREPGNKWKRPDWKNIVDKVDESHSVHAIAMKTWKER